MQNYVMINDIKIKQPDKGLKYDFETTYSEDTTRVQSGAMHLTPLFTVEAFSYTAKDLTNEEMIQILQQVAKGSIFKLHYRSPYHGIWRDDYFYVPKGSMNIGSWKEYEEKYESLSFSMTGVNPL